MRDLVLMAAVLAINFFTNVSGYTQSQKTGIMRDEITIQEVRFSSDGFILAGHLYKPVGFDPSKKYPAVVTAGSLTSVKEQMAGAYAAKLAEEGFVALAFDYRHWGESEGRPRYYEDHALKLADLKSAVTYILSLPYVKDVSALGVCTSGGNMAYLAAADHRVKAVALVASHLSDPLTARPFYAAMGKNVDSLRASGAEARKLFELTGKNSTIPAYSNSDNKASHIGAMDYYMDKTRGGGVKEWTNEFAVMSWGPWLDFDPVGVASDISIPLIMFHADGCALPENAKRFYHAVRGKKELVWDDDGNHFDYYDRPEKIHGVVKKASVFFTETH